MKFSSSFKLPGSRQAISAMLRNPQYYRRRWEKLDPRPSVDLNDQNSTLTVTSTLAFTADTVRKLANFLDSEMTVKVLEIWNFNETGLVQGGTLSRGSGQGQFPHQYFPQPRCCGYHFAAPGRSHLRGTAGGCGNRESHRAATGRNYALACRGLSRIPAIASGTQPQASKPVPREPRQPKTENSENPAAESKTHDLHRYPVRRPLGGNPRNWC